MAITLDGLTGITSSGSVSSDGSITAQNFSSTNAYGMRNRIINGAMAVDQRNSGASQTFTAAAALAYSVDRWYGYCTGANVTGQQVAGSNANTYNYRFTGAASVTAIGFGQRIEALNCADLAGSTATLSVNLSNSLLNTITWTAYYANTDNTFGTLASPTRTLIATGTFNVTSTLTNYSTNISIPSAATTGIEIVFTVGSQTSGTWVIGNVQLEAGSVATPFERRLYQQELINCFRYYQYYGSNTVYGTGSAFVRFAGFWTVPFRATPTVSVNTSAGSATWGFTAYGFTTVLSTNSTSYLTSAVSEL